MEMSTEVGQQTYKNEDVDIDIICYYSLRSVLPTRAPYCR